MSEACKQAFLKHWCDTHDFPYVENAGMYEKHAFQNFEAGWEARKVAQYKGEDKET